MSDVIVLKIGGNEVEDEGFLAGLAEAVLSLRARVTPLLVHGGGKEIARLQQALGIEPRFVEGLRVTDQASLAVAEMVLSGAVNKRLVALFVSWGIPAIGLSGVDAGLLRARRMQHSAGDLGYVGEIVEVRADILQPLLAQGVVPVVSPISLGLDGQRYNVNADHAAMALAKAVQARSLFFVTNVPGVLAEGRIVERLTAAQAEEWIAQGIISGGMVPKVRSALEVVAHGVPEVRIVDLMGLATGGGTRFVVERSSVSS